jgi:hypothetical protein
VQKSIAEHRNLQPAPPFERGNRLAERHGSTRPFSHPSRFPHAGPRKALLLLRAALEAERVEAFVVRPRSVAVEAVDLGAPENDVCRVARAAQEE